MLVPPQCAESSTSAGVCEWSATCRTASMPPLLWPMTIGAGWPRAASHCAAERLSAIASAMVWKAAPSAARLSRIARMSCPRRLKASDAIPSSPRRGGRKRGAPL